MGELTTQNNNELEPNGKGNVPDNYVNNPGKTLTVRKDSINVDFGGILAAALQMIDFGNAMNHIKAGAQYVVQIPVKYQEAFESGELFLNQNSKTNVLWPSLVRKLDNGKQQFVANLPIKQENMIQGNPISSFATAYQNMYMQEQLQELSVQMERTYKLVETVLRGQNSDRIGKMNAGRQTIECALTMKDETERREEIRTGRALISEAQQQFLEVFRDRVQSFEAVPDKEIKVWLKVLFNKNYCNDLDGECNDLQDMYELYLQSTKMVAGSYLLTGDEEAARTVFEDSASAMQAIDFTNLNTIGFIHHDLQDYFFQGNNASEYIDAERDEYLEEGKAYDSVAIEVSGEKLLEVYRNGKEKVSEAESEK